MDGFEVMTMEARGRDRRRLLHRDRRQARDLARAHRAMKDGAILANTGHFNVEIDIPALEELAVSRRRARENVEEFELADGRKALPDRRRAPREPRRRRGSSGRGHGHELREPGARRRVRRAARRRARAARSTTCRRRSTTRSRASSSSPWASRSIASPRSRRSTWPRGTKGPRAPRAHPGSRTTASSSSTSASSPTRRSSSSAARAPRSPRRFARSPCAARPRSAIAAAYGYALAAARGDDLGDAAETAGRSAADRGQPRLGGRRDAQRGAGAGAARRARPRDPLPTRSSAAGRWPSMRPTLLRARRPGAHALQHRRARDRRLRNRARRPAKRLHARGLLEYVFVDETRPLLQGSRLTAWELERAGIPHGVIADSAAATMMARGEVTHVLTGADRIAANGDTANKIGTYALAVLAGHHGAPVLRRRADLDRRPRDALGRRDPDRGAERRRGDRALRRAEPRLRRDARRADRRDRDGARRAPASLRGVARAAAGRRHDPRSPSREGDGDGRRARHAPPAADGLPAEADDAGRQPAGPPPPPEPAPPPRDRGRRHQPPRGARDDPELLRRRLEPRPADPLVARAGAPRHRGRHQEAARTSGRARRS